MALRWYDAAPEELACRLNKLFDVFHRRSEPALSNAEAAEAITAKTGVAVGAEDLDQLRNPAEPRGTSSTGPAQLEAVEDFFGVPRGYLTDRDSHPVIDAQLDQLATLRDTNTRIMTVCGPNTQSATCSFSPNLGHVAVGGCLR